MWLDLLREKTKKTLLQLECFGMDVYTSGFFLANSACCVLTCPISSTVCGLIESESLASIKNASMDCSV